MIRRRQLDADALAVPDDEVVKDLVKVVDGEGDVGVGHLLRVPLALHLAAGGGGVDGRGEALDYLKR